MKSLCIYFWNCDGNEDYHTWNFNKFFKRACPIISELEMEQKHSKFVSVSDHDKGLEKSLQEVFPNDHATDCVHHIKQKCFNEVW